MARFTPPIGLGVAFLLTWVVLSYWVGPLVLPHPWTVLLRLGLELQEDLPIHALSTFGISALGGVLGAMVALPLGYFVSHSGLISRAVSPYLAASQAIPAVALAPLLVVLFGYGLMPKAMLCALMVFFPITINTSLGFMQLEPDLIGAALVDGANKVQLLTQIELPLALPAILAGIRNGLVLSVTGAVVGEFVIGGSGLGYLLGIYRDRYDTAGVLAVLVALAMGAIALFEVVRRIERKLQW